MARSKAFKEEDVLEKAVNLFWSKGYNGSSAQDLVDNLEISRSSLYDTYGDKHSLFIQSLQQYRKQEATKLIAMINSAEDAEQVIKEIFQSLVNDTLKDKSYKGCFMINAAVELGAQDDEIMKIAKENMQVVEDAFYKAVKKGQDAGQFSTKNSARSLARFLFNSMSGIRVAEKSGVEKKVLDDIIKVTLSALK